MDATAMSLELHGCGNHAVRLGHAVVLEER
jgi:hypothetical protein